MTEFVGSALADAESSEQSTQKRVRQGGSYANSQGKPIMRKLNAAILAGILFCAAGCPDPNQKTVRLQIRRLKRRAAPKRMNVALDPALRVAANRELTVELHASDPMLRVHALEGVRDADAVSHEAEVVAALGDKECGGPFCRCFGDG